MTKEESKAIVDKMKFYRPRYEIKNGVYEEWHRVLEPYDFKDVDKKLEDYLKDGENQGRYPDPYYLTRFLRTIEEKRIEADIYVICDICGKSIKPLEFNKHRDRCSSAIYVCEQSRKWFNETLSYKKLMEAPQEKFNEVYYKFCERLYQALPNGLEKHCLENALRTYKGLEPNYNLENLTKQIGG